MRTVSLGTLNQYSGSTVNPMQYPDEVFELYSVPSYDSQYPEIIKGEDIGSSKVTIEPGDILICKINPRINRIWVVTHNTEYRLLASSEWIVVRSPENNADYLRHYFKSKRFQTMMVSQVTGIGGSLTRAQPKQVATYPVPLPDRNTQDQIANILNHLEQIIALRTQQLSSMDEMVKSRFVELFGDPESNPMGWPVKKLNAVVSSITAGWSANGEARPKKAGEKAVLKVSAVTQGYFKPDEHKVIPADMEIKKYVYPQKGDLLFSRASTRELVGATAIIDQDYPELLLPDKLWKVLFTSEMNVYYAKHILSTQAIRKVFSSQSTGTSGSMYNVSAEKFRDTSIPVPPIALQCEFADFVEQIDKSKVEIQNALNELEILKKSLMQQYFG